MVKESIECATQALDNQLGVMRETYLTTMRDASKLGTLVRTVVQHEAKRIQRKLGADHPRVARLETQLTNNLEGIEALNEEKEIYSIDVREVPKDSARVHGRTVDAGRRGIRGLTVCLVDRQTGPLLQVKDSITASSGYFALVLSGASVEAIMKNHPDGVYLAVFGPGGSLLYRERKPLLLGKGESILREICLDAGERIRRGRQQK